MAKLSITYIGQATTLIQLSGQSFLSDPNFSKKVLFNKQPEALVAPESLPPLSGILISDARYRHLDFFSFKFFKSQIPVFCPEGLGGVVRKFLPNPVTEVPRWSFHREGGLELHAVPVKYLGFRILPIRHRAATGWVLKSPEASVFFCAGTGYSEYFSEIASLFDLEAAILPVGLPKATWPRKGNQMNADEVLRAFRDLRAKRLIPIPDSTAVLPGNEDSFFDPLREAAKAIGLVDAVHFLRSGQTVSVE